MTLVYGTIDSTGIHVVTRSQILADLVSTFNGIYGTSLDSADSSNPDVQWLNSIAQSAVDSLDLDVQAYNGMDPDLAIGFVLDQRVTINGLQRLGGTFTIQNISVVINDQISQSLQGLDNFPNDPFTVSDNSGNKWQLINTQTPSVAGAYVYAFSAAVPGAVVSPVNGIQTQVSVVVGVTSVNNPTTYTSLGTKQETDAQLRVRRQKSVALPSVGSHDGLVAAIENIAGITSASVEENDDSIPNSDAVPPHSIWVIVAGTPVGGDILVGEAIYLKRNEGCGMKIGSKSYTKVQNDGSVFKVYWDTVTQQTLYIQLHLKSLDGVTLPNVAAIKAGLVSGPFQFVPGAGAEVNITQVSTLVQSIDPNCYVVPTVADGFSIDNMADYTPTLSPTAKNYQFSVSSSNIFLTASL